jgi:hypothetical protein
MSTATLPRRMVSSRVRWLCFRDNVLRPAALFVAVNAAGIACSFAFTSAMGWW